MPTVGVLLSYQDYGDDRLRRLSLEARVQRLQEYPHKAIPERDKVNFHSRRVYYIFLGNVRPTSDKSKDKDQGPKDVHRGGVAQGNGTPAL